MDRFLLTYRRRSEDSVGAEVWLDCTATFDDIAQVADEVARLEAVHPRSRIIESGFHLVSIARVHPIASTDQETLNARLAARRAEIASEHAEWSAWAALHRLADDRRRSIAALRASVDSFGGDLSDAAWERRTAEIDAMVIEFNSAIQRVKDAARTIHARLAATDKMTPTTCVCGHAVASDSEPCTALAGLLADARSKKRKR